jgi:hypothetical protein
MPRADAHTQNATHGRISARLRVFNGISSLAETHEPLPPGIEPCPEIGRQQRESIATIPTHSISVEYLVGVLRILHALARRQDAAVAVRLAHYRTLNAEGMKPETLLQDHARLYQPRQGRGRRYPINARAGNSPPTIADGEHR